MKVKSESEVAQSCPTLSDPMDCSPPGSSLAEQKTEPREVPAGIFRDLDPAMAEAKVYS